MPALDDDSKVMDVSKPGKGKPVSTSRPVIAPVVSAPAADKSVSSADEVAAQAEPARSPSASGKKIEPLNDLKLEDTPAATEQTDLTEPKPEEESIATPVEDTDVDVSSAGDEAASVDALVSTAQTKREAAKKAEEQAKKDAELQALVDSKKYFVPTKTAGSSSSKKWAVALVACIVLLVGGYVLADIGAFGSGVKVPFEIFKEQEAVSDNSTPADAAQEAEQESDAADEPAEKPQEDEGATSGEPADVTPEMKARDAAKKDELKALQQKLDSFFAANGTHPVSLADLKPQPSVNELTDEKGVAYKYTSDGQTYTLSTVLENTADSEAVEGVYSLVPANQ